MNFGELTINPNNKDDNRSASTTTAANPETEIRFSETPRLATRSSVNHSSSCSVNQPVSSQDLQTIIGPHPFEAPSGFHWVPTWQLLPLHQKAVIQPPTPDVFSTDTPSNKSFEQCFLDKVMPMQQKENKKINTVDPTAEVINVLFLKHFEQA